MSNQGSLSAMVFDGCCTATGTLPTLSQTGDTQTDGIRYCADCKCLLKPRAVLNCQALLCSALGTVMSRCTHHHMTSLQSADMADKQVTRAWHYLLTG